MEPEGYDNGERREQRIHRLLLPCRYDRREARVGSRMLLVTYCLTATLHLQEE